MKRFLLKDPSLISISTYDYIIINGKRTKIRAYGFLKKWIKRFLDWRWDQKYNK